MLRVTLAPVLTPVLGLILAGTPAMATEEPAFSVVLAHDPFSVRDYPALVVAEVTVTGDRAAAASQGFRLLAGYIFGGNTRRQSIAMTAPVVQEAGSGQKIAMTAPVLQSGSDESWLIRFIMPRGSSLETLPKPNNVRVRLRALAPARMAVVQFSGLAWQSAVDAQTAALAAFIKAQHLQPVGKPSLAHYNPPWTLWFLRRNEVMIPLAL
jgi:hypothetical protein